MRNPKRIAAVRYEEKAAKDASREDWLNPIAMSQLQRATNDRKDTVVLNGRLFTLTYGQMQRTITSDKPYECVLVKPASGMPVPMGYVSLARLARFVFDQED